MRIQDYVLTQKIPVDEYIDWRKRVQDYVLTQKIPVESYIDWRTRIQDYVLTKKSQLIHTSTGERGLKIMYSRKKNSS